MAKDFKEVKEEINKRRRELGEYERQARNGCDHKDNRESWLEPVSEYDGFIKDRNQYDEFDMICTECGEIVNMKAMTDAEVDFTIDGIRNMCNQLKILGNLNESEREQIVEILSLTDALRVSLVPFYKKNMKKLIDGNNKKNRGNNAPRKGRMSKAVTSTSFNRR